MRRPIPILAICMVFGLLGGAPAALAHGDDGDVFRTRVLSVEPAGLPVDVRMTRGDEIRFENAGDEDLLLCGYEGTGCTPWVRIGPDGVFEDRNSEAWHINSAGDEPGVVPDDAGTGPSDFVRVRRSPSFYTYHDHRVHWMGGSAVPPSVDAANPDPQKVFDGEVRFRYGDTEGVVRTRLEYVGGRTWIQRYGEYGLMGVGVAGMIGWFLFDARRRRRRRRSAAEADG